jgi:hypothetical protein
MIPVRQKAPEFELLAGYGRRVRGRLARRPRRRPPRVSWRAQDAEDATDTGFALVFRALADVDLYRFRYTSPCQ